MTDEHTSDTAPGPLGQSTDYPDRYSPDVLHPIPRAESRRLLGIGDPLPFSGVDIWNAWELTWLDGTGKPRVATATIRIAADSTNIIESKSLKLYLNGFAAERFATPEELTAVIRRDLGRVVDGPADVELVQPDAFAVQRVATLPGTCIDEQPFDDGIGDDIDPGLLAAAEPSVDETLHTNLLRSLCPVTAQPDTGSLLIRYRGPKIDPAALLCYVVSFRNHDDFHEACVERVFTDLMARCRCEELTVHARYNRRGGIDINPYRSTGDEPADNPRLWRQ